MKKLLAILLVAMMVFSLAACSNNADPSESNNPSQSDDGFLNRDDGSEDNSSDEKSDGKNDAVDPMTRLLNSAGVEFDAIKPDETTFAHTFSESDKKIVFYMESNTETNTAAYLKKILAACKTAADEGKLYEANMGFYTGNRTELAPLTSDEKISNDAYLYQFGYLKDGTAIAVTIGRIGAENSERADSVTYPAYEITFK